LLMVPNSCQDLSVKITGLFIALLALGLSAWGADCPKNQPRTEAALVQLEQNWAAALSRKDVDAVACMLADEFEDADVDGSLHSRSWTLETLALPAGAAAGDAHEAERDHILRMLEASNWVVGGRNGAAERLGMKRTSLVYRMRKLRITRPAAPLSKAAGGFGDD